MKQVIVMRTDLNMRKGKVAAQAAHASLGAVLPNQDDERVQRWLGGSFTKVCVQVDSEENLLALHSLAERRGLITCLITDNGKTEFHGVATRTCVAIGPDENDVIDEITGGLKLL